MLYPRLQAFAERLWNDKTSYDDFHQRLQKHYALMDKKGILYGAEDKNLLTAQLKYLPNENTWRLYAERGTDDMQLHYSMGKNVPDQQSPSFTDSLTITKPSAITIIPFRKNKQAFVPLRFGMIDHKAVGKKAVFNQPYHDNYKRVGDYGLTDGITGSMNYSDGAWMGWWGKDLDMMIDLGAATTIQQLQLTCLQQTQSWILLPKQVEFFVSDDGSNWKQLSTQTHKVADEDAKPQVHAFSYRIPIAIQARYIRVVATNYGKLPAWHNGAGGDAWIFADELIVK